MRPKFIDYVVAFFRPNGATADLCRGFLLIDRGEFVDAISYFDRALLLKSERLDGYVGRAFAKVWIGDWSGAVYDLETAQGLAIVKGDKELNIYIDELLATAESMNSGKGGTLIQEVLARRAKR